MLLFLGAIGSAQIFGFREAARRTKCTNNLRQLALAVHSYHDTLNQLPPLATDEGHWTWAALLLPYVEQEALWKTTQQAFARDPVFYHNPPHVGLDTVVPLYLCPADGRIQSAQTSFGHHVAFTSYLGVMGQNFHSRDGMLYLDSRVRLAEVRDGTSNTLLFGGWRNQERNCLGERFSGDAGLVDVIFAPMAKVSCHPKKV